MRRARPPAHRPEGGPRRGRAHKIAARPQGGAPTTQDLFSRAEDPRAPVRIHRSTRRLSRWGTAETRHRSKHTEGHKPSTPSSEESPRALRQRVPALRARSPRVRAHGEGPRARVCPPHGSGHRVQSCVSGPFGALEQNGAHSGRVPTPGGALLEAFDDHRGGGATRAAAAAHRLVQVLVHPRFSTRFTFLLSGVTSAGQL